jgi:hypothetical protein
VPHINSWKPCYLAKVPDDPQTYTLNVSGSKKEPRYTCLSKAKASHSQRVWAEVSSSAPHLLHNGLSDSPIKLICLLRVLCTVRRPVTTLNCIQLKDRNLALAPIQGPKINSHACLWVLPRPRHHTQYWLTNQHIILLLISCLETPKAGSRPTNFRAELSLVSSSAISFPCTPSCPGTQYSPTACWVEISFNTFWYCWTNEHRCSQTCVGLTVWKMNFIFGVKLCCSIWCGYVQVYLTFHVERTNFITLSSWCYACVKFRLLHGGRTRSYTVR